MDFFEDDNLEQEMRYSRYQSGPGRANQPPMGYRQPQPVYSSPGYSRPPQKKGMPGWLVVILVTVAIIIAFVIGGVALGSLLNGISHTRHHPAPDQVLNANLQQEEKQEYKPLNETSTENEEGPAFTDANETVAGTNPVAVQQSYNGIAYTWFPKATKTYPMPYYRAHLTSDQQKIYDDIFYALNEMNEKIYFENGDVSQSELEMIMDSVASDHPGIFWSDGGYSYYTFGTDDTVYAIEFEYSMSREEKAGYQALIEEITAPVVDYAKTLPNDYEKTKYFYEWLDENIKYSDDLSNIHTQTIKGAFIDKVTACAGYARAFQYLCYCCDIPCIYVTGDGNGDDGKGWVAHAWNACEIDGTSVYQDVTWGDTDDAVIPYNYAFLDLTSDDMVKTNHKLKYPEIMPMASDNRYEWWVMHNCIMGSYDRDAVARRCADECSSGAGATYVMFSDRQSMEECYADFTGENSAGATLMVDYMPYLPDEGMSYWVQKIEPLNLLIFAWG